MTRSPKKSAPRSSLRRVPSGPSSARSMRNLAASTSVATPSLNRAANEAHDMANATEALGPKTDAYKLFMLIPTGGDRVGNISLRRQLGWNEAKYAAAKDRLLESGLVQKDMGKGGSGGGSAAAAAVPVVVSLDSALVRALANPSGTACSHSAVGTSISLPRRSNTFSMGVGGHHMPPEASVAATFDSSRALTSNGPSVKEPMFPRLT